MAGDFSASYLKHKGYGLKIYIPALSRMGQQRPARKYFKTATDALCYAKRWAEKTNNLRKD